VSRPNFALRVRCPNCGRVHKSEATQYHLCHGCGWVWPAEGAPVEDQPESAPAKGRKGAGAPPAAPPPPAAPQRRSLRERLRGYQ